MSDKVICNCTGVTLEDIKEAVNKGAKTLQDIKDMTEASTMSGGCEDDIEEILKDIL